MKKSGVLKHLDFLIIDVIVITISFVSSYLLYIGNINQLINSGEYRSIYLIILLISLCVTYFVNPYSGILKRKWSEELKELFKFVLYSTFVLSLYLVASKTSTKYSRVMLTLVYVTYLPLSLLLRTLWKRMINNNSQIESDQSKTKVLIITTSKELVSTIKKINENNYGEYLVDSICIIDKDLKGKMVENNKIETNEKDVLSYLCHNWIDEVLIATDAKKVPKEIYDGLAQAGIATSIITKRIDVFDNRKQTINNMLGYTVVSTSIAYRSNKQIFLKRLMDITGGLIGCMLTLVLTIIVGPIIYLKSPGPIFFKQERIGQNGRRFKMYKFRSMVMNADDLKDDLRSKNRIKDGMMFKVDNDPRIIPGIGEFIRRTSLDEFPQFINVLKGDMSLVGTRPPTVDEWVKYKLEHRIRMTIKPGITGLWQTNGRSKITDFNKVIEYDTEYINNWTLGLDLEILFKTLLVLFSKREKDEAM